MSKAFNPKYGKWYGREPRWYKYVGTSGTETQKYPRCSCTRCTSKRTKYLIERSILEKESIVECSGEVN